MYALRATKHAEEGDPPDVSALHEEASRWSPGNRIIMPALTIGSTLVRALALP